MPQIDTIGQIVKEAVKAAIPGLLPEYYYSTDFIHDPHHYGNTPAMARIIINVEDEDGFIRHHFTPEQTQRMVDKLQSLIAIEADKIVIDGNCVAVYWLDYSAFAVGELMHRDMSGSFANLLKHRDTIIGRTIELSASLITSYILYIGEERQTGLMQFIIADIERGDDGLIYLRLRPTDERVVIEDNYHGDHHDLAGLCGAPYELLDFHFVDK